MNQPTTPGAPTSTKVPSSRLAPLSGGGGGAPLAARAAMLLLVASAAYLGFVLLRPLPAPTTAALQPPPDVSEVRYAPINDAQSAALAQTIDRANILTPGRVAWRDYFRPQDEALAEDDGPAEPVTPAAGLVQVDDPDTLPQDVQSALAALSLTGIYAPTDGQIRAEFVARHRTNEPSFSVIPGETFEVPRAPNGQLDTWTLVAIDRGTNRVVIQGLNANVPLALFGADVDLTPIMIDESGNATAVAGGPREAQPAPVATVPEQPAESGPLIVEPRTPREVLKELERQQAEGFDVNIAEIFRLMNVDLPTGDDDEGEEEGGSEDEPETPETPEDPG